MKVSIKVRIKEFFINEHLNKEGDEGGDVKVCDVYVVLGDIFKNVDPFYLNIFYKLFQIL